MQTDAAFRLFQRLPLVLRGEVPGRVTGLLGQAGARETLDVLRQCKIIYAGWQLYTAR